MKKCMNCGKVVFACCGNEPGDYCHKCEEAMGGKEGSESPSGSGPGARAR